MVLSHLTSCSIGTGGLAQREHEKHTRLLPQQSFNPSPPTLTHPAGPNSVRPHAEPTELPGIMHCPSFFTGKSSWKKRDML